MNLYFVCAVTLFYILALLIFVIREKNLRRAAQARLEVTRVVTQIEQLMLKGKLTNGEVCHDHLYRSMFRAQFPAFKFSVSTMCRLPNEEARKFVANLKKEIQSKAPEVQKLIDTFLEANLRVFRFSQPFAYGLFLGWIALCRGGLRLIWGTLLLTLKGIETYQKFKTLAGELALALSDDHQPHPARAITVVQT